MTGKDRKQKEDEQMGEQGRGGGFAGRLILWSSPGFLGVRATNTTKNTCGEGECAGPLLCTECHATKQNV